MKRITILAMFNTMASTVIGPMDIFYQAGVVWNYFQGERPTPFFETRIVTTDGKPCKRFLIGIRCREITNSMGCRKARGNS